MHRYGPNLLIAISVSIPVFAIVGLESIRSNEHLAEIFFSPDTESSGFYYFFLSSLRSFPLQLHVSSISSLLRVVSEAGDVWMMEECGYFTGVAFSFVFFDRGGTSFACTLAAR